VRNFRSVPVATIQTIKAVVIKQVKIGKTGDRTKKSGNGELDYLHFCFVSPVRRS
jgi:hypothetical protein